MLIQGDDALLRQELVKKRGLTGSVDGGINLLGNMYNYKGPMLFSAELEYDPTTKSDTVIEAIDTVVEPLRSKPVDQKTVDLALVKLRSESLRHDGRIRRVRIDGSAGQFRAV